MICDIKLGQEDANDVVITKQVTFDFVGCLNVRFTNFNVI